MGSASRGFWLLAVVLGVILSTQKAPAQTTPTLLTVHVTGEDGGAVPGAEGFITKKNNYEGRSAVNWRSAEGGTIVFTMDDTSTNSRDKEITGEYKLIVRAPRYAASIETVNIAAQPAEIDVKMEKGRRMTLEIIPPTGMSLPDDMIPWIVPEKFVWTTRHSISGKTGGDPVSIASPENIGNGQFAFQVLENSPELYVMIHHPGFLQAWQSQEPLSLDKAADDPVRIDLPKPAIALVNFDNKYAESNVDGLSELSVVFSRKKQGTGTWLISIPGVRNDSGDLIWEINDLAPGNYKFQATGGLVESVENSNIKLGPGETKSINLTALSVIRPVVAVDDRGATITDAQGYIVAVENSNIQSQGWTKAEDGVLRFKHSQLSDYRETPDIKKFTVHLRAPGYAVTTATLHAGAPTLTPLRVRMQRGREITMTITSADGRAVPSDLKPIILSGEQFPGGLGGADDEENEKALAVARHTVDNKWEFRIPEDTASLRVSINDDDFIRAFWTESLTDFSDGEMELVLPKTGAIRTVVNITSPPKSDAADVKSKYILNVYRPVKEESGTILTFVEQEYLVKSTTTVIANLAPGDYTVYARPSDIGMFERYKKEASVKAGATAAIALVIAPVPANADQFGVAIPEFPKLKVTGENEKPISAAQAIVRKKSSKYLPNLKWENADVTGVIAAKPPVASESYDGAYEVVVRAPGYRTETLEVTLPTSETLRAVKMSRGTEVALELTSADGQAIPTDLRPAIFPESWGRDVWLTVMPSREGDYAPETLLSPLTVEAKGDGKFTTHVDSASTEPLYVLINHPDFLRGFQAGPFAAADWASSKTVEIELPEPATLTSVFDYSEDEKPESPMAGLKISRSQDVPGGGSWRLGLIEVEAPVTSATLSADDLAPGDYSAEVRVGSKRMRMMRKGFSASESVELDAGASETVVLVYRPFNEKWLKGPYTAVVKVLTPKGEPAAGAEYKVTWYKRQYPQQTIAEGKVPADGVVRLENLAGVEKPVTSEELEKRGGTPSFSVQVNDVSVGDIAFYDYRDGKYHPLEGDVKTKEFEFRLPPNVGDVAPDFEMVDLVTSETIRLSDFKGQVVMIDFWATWCGPCQGPMAENQEIMRKHAEDWDGKAVILAVSIDDEMETVLKHLDKNDWHETRNAWAPPAADDPDKQGFSAPAPEMYGVSGIPTMIVIGKDGVIKARAHHIEVEEEMEKALEAGGST